MAKIYILRVEMNDDEAVRFQEALEQFQRSVSVAFYRGAMTVDEIMIKEIN